MGVTPKKHEEPIYVPTIERGAKNVKSGQKGHFDTY